MRGLVFWYRVRISPISGTEVGGSGPFSAENIPILFKKIKFAKQSFGAKFEKFRPAGPLQGTPKGSPSIGINFISCNWLSLPRWEEHEQERALVVQQVLLQVKNREKGPFFLKKKGFFFSPLDFVFGARFRRQSGSNYLSEILSLLAKIEPKRGLAKLVGSSSCPQNWRQSGGPHLEEREFQKNAWTFVTMRKMNFSFRSFCF